MTENQGNKSAIELMNQKIANHQAILKYHQDIVTIHKAIAKFHESFVIDLKIRRNWLAPISRLPPEIMYNIFFISSRDRRGHGIKWITLTHVCHDWRTQALTTPSLWCNPPFQDPDWTKEMLIRSQDAKLTIQASAMQFNTEGNKYADVCFHNLINTVQTRMDRIKCIELDLPPSQMRFLVDSLPRSAPSLESLTLQCQLARYESMSLAKDSLCNMRHLQHMNLKGVGIHWDLHLPESLTSLTITRIHESTFPTLTELCNALRRLTMLEILNLVTALPQSANPIPATTTSGLIRLDCLQFLTLDGGVAETEWFLKTFAFSPDTFIEINCFPVVSNAYANLDRILRSLGQSLQGRSAPLESVDICNDTISGFTGIYANIDETFFFRIGRDNVAMTVEGALLVIFEEFPFNSVKHLHFESRMRTISPSTLLLTLGSLPNLQTMKILLMQPILGALKSNLVVSEKVAKPAIAFAKLEQMDIVGPQVYDREEPKQEIDFDNLLDCLIWRKEHGAALKRLSISNSYYVVNQEMIDSLKSVVPEVEWGV